MDPWYSIIHYSTISSDNRNSRVNRRCDWTLRAEVRSPWVWLDIYTHDCVMFHFNIKHFRPQTLQYMNIFTWFQFLKFSFLLTSFENVASLRLNEFWLESTRPDIIRFDTSHPYVNNNNMRAVAMAPGLLSNHVVVIIISDLPLEEKLIQRTDKIHSIFQNEGLISL